MSRKNLKTLFKSVKENTDSSTVEVLKHSEIISLKGGFRSCICKGTACYNFSEGGGGVLAPRMKANFVAP